jgi:hypothetical protein
VEIAFPWKVLREFSKQKAPPNDGDIWRVDFSRVEWQIDIKDGKYSKVPNTKEDNWVWSPMGIIDMHRPENWGFVKFVRSDKPAQSFHPQRGADVDKLLTLYYAQKDFAEKNKRFAGSLQELGDPERFTGLEFHSAPAGYRAEAGNHVITQDGLLTSKR